MNEKETIQYYIQRLYDKNLTTMSGGNLSIKSTDAVYVTPSEVDKGRLTPDDIMTVYNDGTVTGKHRVTSEFYVHEAIYEENSDVKAILHSHTSSILGYSSARLLPNPKLLADVAKDLEGKIGLAKYADPGTKQLASETVKALDNNKQVAILENHGLFIGNRSMEECYDTLENIDLLCKIEINVKKFKGKLSELSEEEINSYREFEPNYLQDKNIKAKSFEYNKEKELLIELLQRLYKRGISTCKNACFSYRLECGDILVNPENYDVNELKPEDIILVKDEKYIGDLKPHRDFYLHMSVYKDNKRNNALITVRPPYTMAYACSDKQYITRVVPECYGYLRNINKYKFNYGINACESIKGIFGDYNNTVLIDNYLALVAAEYPLKAYDRVEVLESTAEAVINISLLKEPLLMDQRAVEAIQKNCSIYPEPK